MVVVKPRTRTPSPTATVTHDTIKACSIVPKRHKRRSMSVSDVDLKRVMASASSSTPLPRTSGSSRETENSDWSSIMTDFQGELLQLDPISTGLLDLKDPSTPARKRPTSTRSQSDNVLSTTTIPEERPVPRHSDTEPTPSTSNTPTLSLHQPSMERLNGGLARTQSGSATTSPRVTGLRYGPRSPNSRAAVTSMTYIPSPTRDNNRLRVQHRSTASSSEPSLIPVREDSKRTGKSCSFLVLYPCFISIISLRYVGWIPAGSLSE